MHYAKDINRGRYVDNRNCHWGTAGTSFRFARLAPALLAVVLTSCASMGANDIPEPAQLTNAVNARFAGGPLQAVIDRYGQPASDFMADRSIHVFLWPANTTVRLHEPQTSVTTGTIGDSTYPSRPVPYSQTTTTRVGYDANYTCTMQVGVKPDGSVDAIGFDGKMGACQAFMP